jgi:hypothetical protein
MEGEERVEDVEGVEDHGSVPRQGEVAPLVRKLKEASNRRWRSRRKRKRKEPMSGGPDARTSGGTRSQPNVMLLWSSRSFLKRAIQQNEGQKCCREWKIHMHVTYEMVSEKLGDKMDMDVKSEECMACKHCCKWTT